MIDKLKSIGNKSFTIKGYQRSDGSVVNLLLRMMPPDGYKKLVADSIECIDEFGELLDRTLWDSVRPEVLTSLNNSLTPIEPGEKPQRVSHEQITTVSENIALLDNDPDKVILFRTEILGTETVVEPVKATKSRDDKSAAKKRLMAALPIGRFCFRLNLYKGKYESVDV
jgi:glutamate/tyrosine decarboxylase-like PLP-dependent enzyme